MKFKKQLAKIGAHLVFGLSPTALSALKNLADFEKNVVSVMAVTGRDYDDVAQEMRDWIAKGYSMDGAHDKILFENE